MNTYLDEIVSRLIAFDTVSTKSNVLAMYFLASCLEDQRFHVRLQIYEGVGGIGKCNLVASAGPPEPDGLIISGHVDTVPFENQPGWTHDPLRLEVEDEWVYGRGTSDMKVFLAQCLDAATQLNLSSLKRPIVFIFTADEEVGLGAPRLVPVLPELLGDIPQPRLAWIGEPTSYQVFRAHKGGVIFRVNVHGHGGHSSFPQKGVNAISVAGKVIEVIGHYQAELSLQHSVALASLFPDSPYTILNFGTITGGTAQNTIAEECSLLLSYRPLPHADPLEVYHEIAKRMKGIYTRDYYYSPDHRATIELGEPFVVPALLSPPGTPLELALFDVLNKDTSTGAYFGSDGGWFEQAGIASLICGPGDINQAHQPNEAIRRDAMEKGTGVILSVVNRLCA